MIPDADPRGRVKLANRTDLICHLLQEMATSMEADAEDLLVLDFQATWCGPCKMMVPVVEQLARVDLSHLSCHMLEGWPIALCGTCMCHASTLCP